MVLIYEIEQTRRTNIRIPKLDCSRLRNGRREILHVGDDVSFDCKGTGLEPSDDISFATVDFILLIRSNNDVDRLL